MSTRPDGPLAAVASELRAAGCVFAEEEARLLIDGATSTADLEAMIARRVAGEPLEQVVGWAELCGLRVAVEAGVFVPRPRSELLVKRAVEAVGEARAGWDPGTAVADPGGPPRRPVVADLCCGSGALAAAIAAAAGPLELHAVDVDPVAVRCARGNLGALGARVYEGDLLSPLPAALRGRLDVVVANVPYVPSAEIGSLPREARLHEPAIALNGGADGLDVARRLLDAVPPWLAPGGWLLFETSEGQSARAAALVSAVGLRARVSRSEELDATVVIGQ